jgi:pyruvate,water dikinase
VPPSLVTEPGKPRLLFLDVTLVLQGLTKPISPLGVSIFKTTADEASSVAGTPRVTNSRRAAGWAVAGRFYLNLSNVIRRFPRKRIARGLANIDPLTARIVEEIDPHEYSGVKVSRPIPWRFMPYLFEIVRYSIWASRHPDQAISQLQDGVSRIKERTIQLRDSGLALNELRRQLMVQLISVIRLAIPLIVMSRIGLQRLKKMFPDVPEHEFRTIERGLEGNVTTEMGLALWDSARLLPKDIDQTQLHQQILDRSAPEAFLAAWDRFIDMYGHRAPNEIDVAAPRYREQPDMLIGQLITLRDSTTESDNPRVRFDRAASDRLAFEQKLRERLHGRRRIARFDKLVSRWNKFAGLRETHKYCLVLVIDALRNRLLRDAAALVKSGRLASVEQIFDVTLQDLGNGEADLQERARQNRIDYDRLARVPQLPAVFDSRGRILRPKPLPLKEGEVAGTPIAPGVARGRVKTLQAPDEKPLLRGEILVARATDPGWTPLFVSAAAVILEVGGMLQHGALVAREYGLPCVSGVENATSLWPDGTEVEVDGSSGVIRPIQAS